MIEKLKNYETIFEQNDFHGEVDEEVLFEHFDLGSYVVFSAPHSVRTVIHGKERFSDRYTGAIASYLKEKSRFSTIIRKKFVPEEVSIIDFVTDNSLENHFYLDVHGMRSDVDFELAVGIGYFEEEHYETQLTIIEALAKKYEISWVINHPNYQGRIGFTGKYQQRYEKANILQLEWRKDMRDFIAFPENVIERTIPFLIELAQEIEATRRE